MRRIHIHFLFALLISAILFTPAPSQKLNGHSSAPLKLTLPMKDGSTRLQ